MTKTHSFVQPGMRVAVIGVGISGRAAARFCLSRGAEVILSDHRKESLFVEEEKVLLEEGIAGWEAGSHTLEFLRQADLVLPSPGLSSQHPILTELREYGLPIKGELAMVAGEIGAPVIAVTGTNGKTTVTTLIGKILQDAGKKVFVGGNIGAPLYNCLSEGKQPDLVVAEVSSFQLELAGEFSPHVGLLLNMSPDHLDRHGSMEEYFSLKSRIFRNQSETDFAILGGDDNYCRRLDGKLHAQTLFFGSKKNEAAVINDGVVEILWHDSFEEYPLEKTQMNSAMGAVNCAAAILATRAIGCRPDSIRESLMAFSPLSHRLELVTSHEGVSYYNDSKATNSGAVIAALQQFKRGVVLIAGGRDKGDDFILLRPQVREKVKGIVLIGEATSILKKCFEDLVPVSVAKTMDHAVRVAAGMAITGDTVLLSPGCASFDMFRSYGHRGDEFRLSVERLKESGEQEADDD